jgi:hypothetical protein
VAVRTEAVQDGVVTIGKPCANHNPNRVTEGVYRHIKLVPPRAVELKSKNRHELEEGRADLGQKKLTVGRQMAIYLTHRSACSFSSQSI